MKIFINRKYEIGKCQSCGVVLPDRFLNPYYCWDCFRRRTKRSWLIGVGIVSAFAVLIATGDWWAFLVVTPIIVLLIWYLLW